MDAVQVPVVPALGRIGGIAGRGTDHGDGEQGRHDEHEKGQTDHGNSFQETPYGLPAEADLHGILKMPIPFAKFLLVSIPCRDPEWTWTLGWDPNLQETIHPRRTSTNAPGESRASIP